jgi:hypothetical protein
VRPHHDEQRQEDRHVAGDTRVSPETRALVEQALQAADGRSRAAIAREYGVSTRTVTRYAEALGLNDPFSTRDTRKATESARDRRRALRSELADTLLVVEVPRLLERLAGQWRKTLVIPAPDGAYTASVVEDDVLIARGLRELHTAVGIAIDKTVVIDKHDAESDDDTAGEVLDKLFAGLGAAYQVLKSQPEQAPAEDEHDVDADGG